MKKKCNRWLVGLSVCAAFLQGVAPLAQAGEIASGESVAGQISITVTSNVYTFLGRAGDRVKIRMTEIDPEIGPYIKLYNPQGKCFAYADSDCCQYRAAQINVALRKDGVHTIICKDRESATGKFNVCMVCLPGCALSTADSDFGDLGVGQTVAGSIDQAGDLDIAFFVAEPGDRILIRMSRLDKALDPSVQLYAPDGQCLSSSDKRNPQGVCELDTKIQKSGTYTIVCQDRYVNTGQYTLAVLPAPDKPFTLSGFPGDAK
ncbi:MAG: hypothetical protein V2A34_02955 [Lentisphaerota bacterium]